MQQFDRELVSGSISRSVWKLTWPFVLAQIIRGLNILVAQSLVGRAVGYEGIAAVGLGWQLFMMTIAIYVALLQGMAIVIARYSGKQDSEAITRVIYETFLCSIIFLVAVVAPLGYFLAPYMLDLLNAAPEVQVHALPFTRLIIVCCAPLLLMFLLTRSFQACGDVKTPLMLAILSTVCNIGLNVLFIVYLDMGVKGVAFGFILGPLPSLCIALWLIFSGRAVIRPPKRFTLIPDLNVLKLTLRIGIPTGISALLATGVGAAMLSMLGSLEESAAAQAAFTVCFSQLFSFFIWVGLSLGAASNTLIGQNIGAGETERGKKCVYMAAQLGALWSLVLGVVFWFYPERLLAIFGVVDGPVLDIGMQFLRVLSVAGVFAVTARTLFGGLMGAGDTKSPMYITFVAQVGVILGYCGINAALGTLTATTVVTATLMAAVTRCILAFVVFERGKWVHIQVELEDDAMAEGDFLGG